MHIRWILCLMLAVGLSSAMPAPLQKTDETALLETVDEMVQVTARLRDLEPKAPILKGVKSRDEITQYLNERVQEDYDRLRLQKEGETLKRLGLIPSDLDYMDFILKLLTEQVGGYYDPEKKTLYLASWLPVEEQKPIMVHELTHALQDQYFDIQEILEKHRNLENDDCVLAHQALFEGEAMVLMLQYILEPMKRHFSELPDLAFIMRAQMSTMQSQFAVFESAPIYVQEMLLFPYGYGASFLQQAWKQNPSWQFVNKIYSDLPASTEQIIHPEKYFTDRDEPIPVETDEYAARLGKSWNIAYKNVLGEFSLSLLLRLHLTDDRAMKSVRGWGGDRILLLENKSGENAVLVNTVWDSEPDSEKFFAAMDEWFRQHYPDSVRSNESPTGFSIVKNGEFHTIRREGSSVRFLIGLPETDRMKLKEF
jgi:hypothetical protein